MTIGVLHPGAMGAAIGAALAGAGHDALYLAGAGAGTVAALFAGTAVDARVLAPAVPPMAASALKMAYAAWTKGSAALLLRTGQPGGFGRAAAKVYER